MNTLPGNDGSAGSDLGVLGILDQISDMVTIHDKDFTIIYANKAFADYAGLPREEILDEKCYALIHGCNMPVVNCPHRQTLAGGEPACEEVHDPASGRTFHVSTFPHYSAAGDFSGSVHIIRDITADRERELRCIAQEALFALSLNSSASPPGSEKVCVGVHDTIDKVLVAFERQGRLRQVALERRYCQAEPVIAWSEGALRLVLVACVANALDAMVGPGRLLVETSVRSGAVLVDVVDIGCGIPPENIHSVFKPFFTTRGRLGGTGLGLSIAREVARLHGGEIEVRSSSQGEGSTMRISFPESGNRS